MLHAASFCATKKHMLNERVGVNDPSKPNTAEHEWSILNLHYSIEKLGGLDDS
jgi:hypothetical protein